MESEEIAFNRLTIDPDDEQARIWIQLATGSETRLNDGHTFQDFANKRPYKSFQVLQKLYNLAASQEGNYKEFYNKIARKPIFTGTVTGFDFVRNIMKKFQSYSQNS